MTSIDICNLALSYLGDTATVASINPPEGSAQAQHCARFYPMALNLMLEAHQWNFITRRASLAVLEVIPKLYRPWCFAYAPPADMSTLISVLPESLYLDNPEGRCWETVGLQGPYPFEREHHRREFRMEVDANGNKIVLSNAHKAIARYTTVDVQSGAFTALFTDALAWRLASMLAGPLLKGDAGAAESKRCLQMCAAISSMAMEHDANQQEGAPRHVPVWVGDR